MSVLNFSSNVPENVNPLNASGFMFQIQKLPGLTYFCQRVNLPALTASSSLQATPFGNINQRGDILEYSDLTVEFLIDAKMENYKAINSWMVDTPELSKAEDYFSDGFIHVLDTNNQTVQTIQFSSMTPVSLEGITFETTSADVQYLVGSVTFRYTNYKFI